MSEFWEEVTETLEDWGESILDGLKSLFESGSNVAGAALQAFVSSFAENVDDMLATAAASAVSAVQAQKSEDDDSSWSDYLSAAVDQIADDLGDDLETYSQTALVSAAQAAYTQMQAEATEAVEEESATVSE